MKVSTLKIMMGCFMVSLLSACQLQAPQPTAEIQAEDLCQMTGIVANSDCGPIIVAKNGDRIYTEDTRGYEMVTGQEVEMGYIIIAQPDDLRAMANGGDESCSGCGSGGSSHTANAALYECLADQQTSLVRMRCIQSLDDATE
ncbi:MAG: hypothetical protein AAFR61_08925 [Bacteroidota bacterium]